MQTPHIWDFWVDLDPFGGDWLLQKEVHTKVVG